MVDKGSSKHIYAPSFIPDDGGEMHMIPDLHDLDAKFVRHYALPRVHDV